jgi:hypothetical protein
LHTHNSRDYLYSPFGLRTLSRFLPVPEFTLAIIPHTIVYKCRLLKITRSQSPEGYEASESASSLTEQFFQSRIPGLTKCGTRISAKFRPLLDVEDQALKRPCRNCSYSDRTRQGAYRKRAMMNLRMVERPDRADSGEPIDRQIWPRQNFLADSRRLYRRFRSQPG